MNIFQKIAGHVRETINIDNHIDTDAAEQAIRGNIEETILYVRFVLHIV